MPTPAQRETRTGADEAAQRWFLHEIHPHEGQLKAYLRKAYPAVPDPADIVQESFLRVWKARAAAPVRAIVAVIMGVGGVYVWVNNKAKKRMALLEEQLPDAVELMVR